MQLSCSNQTRQYLIVIAILVSFALICIISVLIVDAIYNGKSSNQQHQQESQQQPTIDTFILHEHMQVSKTIYIDDQITHSGYISSPNYPSVFPINITSSASILALQTGRTEAIKLTFLDLNLQTSNNCEGEALEIYTTTPSRASDNRIYPFITGRYLTICGNAIPNPVVVPAQGCLLHLWNDEFSDGLSRGFKLRYEFIDSKKTNGCPEADMFMCRNRNCISNSLICDRVDDCGDASDEDSQTPCLDVPTISYSTNYKCGLSNIDRTSALTKPKRIPDRFSLIGMNIGRQSSINNRIVGGDRVRTTGSWPSLVSIQMMSIEPVSHLCGGTLIHPLFVLTAAHCFKESTPTSHIRIVFGIDELRLSLHDGPANVQVRYAHLISIYPGLPHEFADPIASSGFERANNVALIEMNAPIEMTPYVWPACLPHLLETLSANRKCFTAGFGETRGTGSPFSLKQTAQVVIHSSKCNSSYSDFEVDDYHMICVSGTSSNGPCNGDSGGPLICVDNEDTNDERSIKKNQKSTQLVQYIDLEDEVSSKSSLTDSSLRSNSRYTVHGVTSFATDGNIGGGFCGVQGVPIIYSRISTRVEWILSLMKLSMFRLGDEDNKQDINDWKKLFGYMFRTGFSRHQNFTHPMTINPTQQVDQNVDPSVSNSLVVRNVSLDELGSLA